jgi:hypothetical protein
MLARGVGVTSGLSSFSSSTDSQKEWASGRLGTGGGPGGVEATTGPTRGGHGGG